MKNPSSLLTTSRQPTQPRLMRYVGSVQNRASLPFPLNAKQQALVDSLVDGKVTVAGREFTREELYACFKGLQLPRDPAVCEALGLHIALHADLTDIEARICAQMGSGLPTEPSYQRYTKD